MKNFYLWSALLGVGLARPGRAIIPAQEQQEKVEEVDLGKEIIAILVESPIPLALGQLSRSLRDKSIEASDEEVAEEVNKLICLKQAKLVNAEDRLETFAVINVNV